MQLLLIYVQTTTTNGKEIDRNGKRLGGSRRIPGKDAQSLVVERRFGNRLSLSLSSRSGRREGTMTGEDVTLLIIEDEQMLARAYKRMLRDTYTVHVALDGEEGLEMATDDIDVILLDRRMPKLSGDEVLSRLVEQDYDAKIALLTAVDPDVDIAEMRFDDYRTKPLEGEHLTHTVESLLERMDNDAETEEFVRVAIKIAALESVELESTDTYQSLVDRLRELHGQVEITLADALGWMQYDEIEATVE